MGLALMADMFASVLLAALAAAAPATSPPCSGRSEFEVTGVVIDGLTHRAVAGAQVRAAPASDRLRLVQAETDGAGVFRLCVPAESFPVLLYAEAPDRVTDTFVVSSPANADQAVRLVLGKTGNAARLRGRVYDPQSGRGMVGVAVQVGHHFHRLTDRNGRFDFASLPGGDYVLSAQLLGYQPAVDTLDLAPGANLEVAIPLAQAVINISPIIVTSRSKGLEQVGFYARRETGLGSHLTRTDIDKMRGIALPSDLLRGFSGVNLARRPNGRGYRVVGRNQCPYRYYVDGVRIGPNFEFDDLEWHWIDAIEVYNGLGQIPARFADADPVTARACGVVVVWTRQVAR